ncbi:MAG TPA: hypothetical protein VGD38_11035, partial [Pyrinomonadaceae bacterium]
ERAAANHREVSLAAKVNWLRKTLQSRVTLVFDHAAGLRCFCMGGAAVGVAELHVFWRCLKSLTNGVVIGNDDCGRLMTINQEQGES